MEILGWSVEGFNSSRQSGGFGINGPTDHVITKSDPPAEPQRKEYNSSSPDLL